MRQFQANLGNSVILNRANVVSNQYGTVVGGKYQPAPAIGSFTSVFDTPEDPNDSQLRIYTLTTWIGGYTMPALADSHLAILGKLSYGIGGASIEVDFDWKMGTQFSVAASFVRVMAAFSEYSELSPPEVRIGCMVGSGSRAARAQITRSYPQLTLDAEAVTLFPVPPMAHALNLFSTPDFYESEAVTIKYVGGATSGISSPSGSLAVFESDGGPFLNGLASEDGVRFPESARWVQITNNSESAISVVPCFTLSL